MADDQKTLAEGIDSNDVDSVRSTVESGVTEEHIRKLIKKGLNSIGREEVEKNREIAGIVINAAEFDVLKVAYTPPIPSYISTFIENKLQDFKGKARQTEERERILSLAENGPAVEKIKREDELLKVIQSEPADVEAVKKLISNKYEDGPKVRSINSVEEKPRERCEIINADHVIAAIQKYKESKSVGMASPRGRIVEGLIMYAPEPVLHELRNSEKWYPPSSVMRDDILKRINESLDDIRPRTKKPTNILQRFIKEQQAIKEVSRPTLF